MINIKIENIDNKIKLTVECKGSTLNLIHECTYLIDSTMDINRAAVDQLPNKARLIVMSNALDSMIERLKKRGEDND